MIVPFPISFTFNFSVGKKFVMVEMNLSTADDSQEVVTQFIQSEKIPIYLESSLLSAVEAFLRDAIQAEKDEEDEQCVLEDDIFLKQATQWNHAFVDSNLKWNVISHAHLATPKVERDKQYVGFIPAYQWIVSRPSGLSTIIKKEKAFSSAIGMLMNGKETSLESLRIRLSVEMDEALKTLEPEQISELVNTHVAEMDQAQKKWSREIKALKKRQKEEYHNFVKEYYLSEQLLVSVNESLHPSLPTTSHDTLPTPSPFALPHLSTSVPASTSLNLLLPSTPRNRTSSASTPRDTSPSTPREQPPSTPSTPREFATSTPRPLSATIPQNLTPTPAPNTPSVPSESSIKFNLPIPITSNAKKVFAAFPFGKVKTDSSDDLGTSTLPLSSTPTQPFPTHANLPSSPVPSPLYNNDPLYFLNKEGREISKKLFFHETIPVYLGRQRKNLFYFKLFSGELIEFCAPKERPKSEMAGDEETEDDGEGKGSRIRQKKKITGSLYGNSLSALVLLVPPDLSYKSETCEEFVNICGTSTEFHFETFKEQLTKVRTANPRLNSGDFFITKHSNLLHINVVFHLVVDSTDALLQEESTFGIGSNAAIGLRNIILTASQCDVHSIVIPAALCEPGLESANEGALKNRVDAIAKTVRLALTSTGEGGSLKTIQFVVREPPHASDQPLYKKLKTQLTASNKSQQLAFKI